jgi:hypothetical protein
MRIANLERQIFPHSRTASPTNRARRLASLNGSEGRVVERKGDTVGRRDIRHPERRTCVGDRIYCGGIFAPEDFAQRYWGADNSFDAE